MAYELSWIEPERILGFKISDHLAHSNARLVSSHEEAMAVLQRIDLSLVPQARG